MSRTYDYINVPNEDYDALVLDRAKLLETQSKLDYMRDAVEVANHLLAEEHAEVERLKAELAKFQPFTKYRQRFERGRIEVQQVSEAWMDGTWLYRKEG